MASYTSKVRNIFNPTKYSKNEFNNMLYYGTAFKAKLLLVDLTEKEGNYVN